MHLINTQDLTGEDIHKAVQKYGSVPYSEMAQMLDEIEMDDLRYWMFHYHFNDK